MIIDDNIQCICCVPNEGPTFLIGPEADSTPPPPPPPNFSYIRPDILNATDSVWNSIAKSKSNYTDRYNLQIPFAHTTSYISIYTLLILTLCICIFQHAGVLLLALVFSNIEATTHCSTCHQKYSQPTYCKVL